MESAYLILEIAKPWPKKIKAEGAVAGFKPLLKREGDQVKLLATPRIEWLPLDQGPWALLVRWWRGQALVQEMPAQPELVRAALRADPQGHPTRLHLVCTHGTRDRCCGTLGFPVYRALAESSSRRVLQVSHLGGHRYAPVVLVLPEWRFFGHLDAQTCREMDSALGQGQPYLPGYRGNGRLPEMLQPIEARLWEQFGKDLVSLTPHSPLGSNEILVSARLAGGSERAYLASLSVRRTRGYKSCSDIPGGSPKIIELPTLASLQEVALSELSGST
jgi:hypothetical protein